MFRHGGSWIDEFDPGKDKEQEHRGPDAKCCGVGQAIRKFTSIAGASEYPCDSIENRRPWIDNRPQVAHERRHIGKADPDDDADHGRSVLPTPALVADETRADEQ